MNKIEELLKQQADIKEQINKEMIAGKREAISSIKRQIKIFGITASALSSAFKPRKKRVGTKVKSKSLSK